MSGKDPIEFCGEVKHETDGAYLVHDGENDVWLPKSQIQEKTEINKRQNAWQFTIPEWLAIEKGII